MQQGMQISLKDGTFFVSGVINEFADFSEMLKSSEDPLRINLRDVSRINSTGVRNLLKLLNGLGDRGFEYHEATSEFIDQVNMIPALLGSQSQGRVCSLQVPYECSQCDAEEEYLSDIKDIEPLVRAGQPLPARDCSSCGAKLRLIADSFFVFLTR